ncbi:MAG: hypothetical protein JJU11_09345 [Candidatus Sumerlaeia bacterium]|nr:hypothetical protein [Candidatus Sumerlaeia bacterium]
MTFSNRHLITSTILSAALFFHWGSDRANAQTDVESTFTYQGQLQLSGEPYDGEVEMIFRLFGVDEGGSELASSVTVEDLEVSSGVFSADLDFGYDTFDGTARWIEIEVNGTVLEPRQPIMATPYALYALDGNEGPPGPAGPTGPEGASPFELVDGNAIFANGQVAVGRTTPFGSSKLSVQTFNATAGYLQSTGIDPVLRAIGMSPDGNGMVTSIDTMARSVEDPAPGLTNRIILRLLASNGGMAAAGSMEAIWVEPDIGNQVKADLAFRTHGEGGFTEKLRITHDGGIIARHFNTATGVGNESTVVSGDRNIEFAKGTSSSFSGWFRFWNEFPDDREEQFRILTSGNARLRGTLTQNAFDIAESFLRTDDAQPGQLIAVDPDNPHAVRLATSHDGGAVIGVVSTEPGIVLGGAGMDVEQLRVTWGEEVHQKYMNERADILADLAKAKPALAEKVDTLQDSIGHAAYERNSSTVYTASDRGSDANARHSAQTQLESMAMDEFAERHFVEVALAGRVPVQVDAAFGEIEVGDYIAASPTPGVAQKATSPGPVIGTALESHGEGDGEIIVFVHRGHYDPNPGAVDTTKEELVAEINALEERLERLEALLDE